MRKAILCLLAGASLSACSSVQEKRLQTEIQLIEARVAETETQIDQHTSAIALDQAGIRARSAYRPIIAWSNSLSAAPPDQRSVRFRQTSTHGYIVKRKINNPWPIPDGEWYVEIDNSTATKADLVIGRFDLQPEPGGLTLRTPLDFHVESRIHAHFDPGPGGGIGTNIFIDGDKSFNALFRLVFLPPVEGALPYRLELVSPDTLKITISAHLGGIGNYGHPFEFKNLARQLSEGRINLLLEQSGQLEPLPDGPIYTYRLHTSNPAFAADAAGIVISSDVTAEVVPQ